MKNILPDGISPAEYCRLALKSLYGGVVLTGHKFGEVWCNLRMEFSRRYNEGLIFSTRLGADFFAETLAYITTRKDFLEPPAGSPLGEYDVSYNKCLKKWRKMDETYA